MKENHKGKNKEFGQVKKKEQFVHCSLNDSNDAGISIIKWFSCKMQCHIAVCYCL